MRCPKCGSQIPETSHFCPKCGTPIKQKKKSEKRPNKTLLILICVLLFILLAVGAAFGMMMLTKARSKQSVQVEEVKKTDTDQESEAEKAHGETADAKEDEGAGETEEAVATTAAETTAAASATGPEQEEHSYEVVIEDCSWNEAYQKAIEKGGYLVHFDTADEYNEVKDLISGEPYRKIKFWIGGRRTGDSHEYHWINGDGTYDPQILNDSSLQGVWLSGEPSFEDEGTEELYMNIFYYEKEERWVWNDVSDDIIAAVPSYAGTVGYIIEYDHP